MPTPSDNHEFDLYEQGETPWTHRDDFRKLDKRLELRGGLSERPAEAPDGTLFVETDESDGTPGARWRYDAAAGEWVQQPLTAPSVETGDLRGTWNGYGTRPDPDLGAVSHLLSDRGPDQWTGAPDPRDPETTDVFLVAGQSNANGRGDAALSPDPPADAAFEFDGNGLVALDDPVGDADTGSAWPAFADELHARTGRELVVVEAARDSTAMTQAADIGRGHWDVDTGGMYGLATDKLDDALAYLDANGDDPAFRGVLWSQGEQDAMEVDAGGITVEDYYASFAQLVAQFREDYGTHLPVWLFRTGHERPGDTAGYRAVRDAQNTLATRQPATVVAWEGASRLPERGLMSDRYHSTQAGYNEMGRMGGRVVAAALRGQPIQRARRGDRLASTVLASGEVAVDERSRAPRVGDGHTPGGRAVSTGQGTSVVASGNQTIPSGATDRLAWDAAEFDHFDSFDGGANRIVVPFDGKWRVTASVVWSNAITAGTWVRMRAHYGSTDSGAAGTATTSNYQTLNVSKSVALSAGDAVYVTATHDSSEAETIRGDLPGWTFLQVEYDGEA